MGREAELVYICRDKVKGVPHHAKAGNINSALLKEAPGKGEYILVLDCDMICHPGELRRSDVLLTADGQPHDVNFAAWQTTSRIWGQHTLCWSHTTKQPALLPKGHGTC